MTRPPSPWPARGLRRRPAFAWFWWAIASGSPTRTTRTPASCAALAPATVTAGAPSPPIASSAMGNPDVPAGAAGPLTAAGTSLGAVRLVLDGDDLPTRVRPAHPADRMRSDG